MLRGRTVMLQQHENRPVFYYSFKPLMDAYRAWPGDGGFALAIYQNGDAMVTSFHVSGAEREQKYFHVPVQLTDRIERLLVGCDNWMGGIPQSIPAPEQYYPRFSHRIGVSYYPMVEIEDIGAVSQLPFGNGTGRAARHITSLLQDISEILLSMGVHFGIDGIEIDEEKAGQVQTVSARRKGEEHMWRGASGF